jgi:hypothetical protein
MKKYQFLFKPLFFIFNLCFACWLVLKIEKISPSDFGKHRSLFESAPKPASPQNMDSCTYAGKCLRNLAATYKSGLIDDSMFHRELETLLKTPFVPKDTAAPVQKNASVTKTGN